MTIDEFAVSIDGKQIEEWQTSFEMHAEAKKSNMVIAFVNDDERPFLSLEGALEADFDIYANDDVGFWSIEFTKKGELLTDEELSALNFHFPEYKYNIIETYFKPNSQSRWLVELPDGLPVAKFTIWKENELFCNGIVFDFETLV